MKSTTSTVKTLLRESKRNLNKERNIPCSWTVRLNTVNMSFFSKLIFRFNIIPIKLPEDYL